MRCSDCCVGGAGITIYLLADALPVHCNWGSHHRDWVSGVIHLQYTFSKRGAKYLDAS